MSEKRYSIVRVDNGWCPLLESDELCDIAEDCFSCKIKTRYGDTKEQLIKKITTVLRREKIKRGLTYYWLATKIVEFLGVEE